VAYDSLEQLLAHADVSHGEVTQTETMWCDEPLAGGLFDPAIFGPLDGSQRRWGHIELGQLAIAGRTLATLPVPPIAERPPSIPEDPAARALSHGPVNEAWLDLLQAVALYRRVVARKGDVAKEAEHVVHHIEDLFAVIRGDEPSAHHADPNAPKTDAYLVMPCAPREPAAIRSLLFLDEERLLVQTTRECRIVDRMGTSIGESIDAWAPIGLRATSVHGDLVIYNGGQREDESKAGYDKGLTPEGVYGVEVAAFDLQTHRWRMLVDETLPPWVVWEDEYEGVIALELATDGCWPLTHDQYTTALAQTRDARFVLTRVAKTKPSDDDDGEGDGKRKVGDTYLAVYELASRRPFLRLPSAAGLTPQRIGPPIRVDAPSLHYARGTGWRIVDPRGAIGDGERWWFRLEGAIVTAWSPSGQLGAIVANDAGGEELVIADVTPEGATVISRARL
jgi:hypothetical protein